MNDPQAIPVVDLHCDLLAYLARVPGANIMKSEDIGVSVPRLREGKVATQVLAVYSSTEVGSTAYALEQVEHFLTITTNSRYFRPVKSAEDLSPVSRVNVILAIENASCFCEETGSVKKAFDLLQTIIRSAGPLAYISFTHHTENRFGGGNYSKNVGLKEDGKALLDWLDGRNIPVDLAHASDQLAFDIFDRIDQHGLNIPVIASHSNFRAVCDHVRNLPVELAEEVLRRGGLIGINFLRAYIHDSDPDMLTRHVGYGWNLAHGRDGLALGADFFSPVGFPWPERFPLFFPEHEHAGRYQPLLQQWKAAIPEVDLYRLAYTNATEFFKKTLFS